jgi:hypothetical protein
MKFRMRGIIFFRYRILLQSGLAISEQAEP